MDVSAGADPGFSTADDGGAADQLASPNESENQSTDNVAAETSAPAASPSQPDFVNVPGFGRVHKDDAPKAREFVKGAFAAFERATLTEKDLRLAKADPEKFLEKFGIDGDAYAQRRLARKLEESLQSPEQRKMSEQERAFAEREAQLKAREEALEKQRLDELTQREVQHIETSIIDALKANGLPPRRETLREMAAVAKDYLRKGIDAPWDHVAQLVADQRKFHETERIKGTFEESTDEDLGAFMSGLSDKARERVRGWFLGQIKSPQTASTKPAPKSHQEPRKPAPRKTMSESEWRQWMNK